MPLSLLDRWRAPAPDPARVAWLGEWDYAHRGLHGPGLPENSPAAFAAAIGRGMGIECDVQRSYDGQAMVFHAFHQNGPRKRLAKMLGEPWAERYSRLLFE